MLTRLAGTPDSQDDPGPVIITEFLAEPVTHSQSQSQWIELFNSGRNPIDLSGWSISVIKNRPGTEAISPDEPLLIQPEQFLVLGTRPTFEKFRSGGFRFTWGPVSVGGGGGSDEWQPEVDVLPLDYEFKTIGLYDDGRIELRDPEDKLIDKIRYFKQQLVDSFDSGGAKSISLSPNAFDAVLNDRPENWCGSSSLWIPKVKATPGRPNDDCPEGRFVHIESGQPPSLRIAHCPDSAMPWEVYSITGNATASAYAGYFITAIDVNVPDNGILESFRKLVHEPINLDGELPGGKVNFWINIRAPRDAVGSDIVVRVFAEMTDPRGHITVAEGTCSTKVEKVPTPTPPTDPSIRISVTGSIRSGVFHDLACFPTLPFPDEFILEGLFAIASDVPFSVTIVGQIIKRGGAVPFSFSSGSGQTNRFIRDIYVEFVLGASYTIVATNDFGVTETRTGAVTCPNAG